MKYIRASRRGASVWWVLLTIALLGAIVFGIYKTVRWFFGWWPRFGAGGRAWWHVHFAEPVFNLMVRALGLAGGDPVYALAWIALGYWLMLKLVGYTGAPVLRGMLRQSHDATENVISEFETAHGKLRKLFADDIEKMALYGGAYETEGKTSRTSMAAGCSGCSIAILWSAISGPLSMMTVLAIMYGVERVFEGKTPLRPLFGNASSSMLAHVGSIPKAAWAGFALYLDQRSLALTIAVGVLGYFVWLLAGMSSSGWTLPRITQAGPLLTYTMLIVLSYWFLSTAFLIFGLWCLGYSLAWSLLSKFWFRPAWLRVTQGISWKRRQTAAARLSA